MSSFSATQTIERSDDFNETQRTAMHKLAKEYGFNWPRKRVRPSVEVRARRLFLSREHRDYPWYFSVKKNLAALSFEDVEWGVRKMVEKKPEKEPKTEVLDESLAKKDGAQILAIKKSLAKTVISTNYGPAVKKHLKELKRVNKAVKKLRKINEVSEKENGFGGLLSPSTLSLLHKEGKKTEAQIKRFVNIAVKNEIEFQKKEFD